MNQTTYEIGFPVNTLSPSEQFDYSAAVATRGQGTAATCPIDPW